MGIGGRGNERGPQRRQRIAETIADSEFPEEVEQLLEDVIRFGDSWLGEEHLRGAGLSLEDMQWVIKVAAVMKETRRMHQDHPEVQEQIRAAGRRRDVMRRLVFEAKELLDDIIDGEGKLIEGPRAVAAFKKFMRLPSFYGGEQEELLRQRRGNVVAGIAQGVVEQAMNASMGSQQSQGSQGSEGDSLRDDLRRARQEDEDVDLIDGGGEEGNNVGGGVMNREIRELIYERLSKSIGRGTVTLRQVISGKLQLPLSREVIDVLRGLFPAAAPGAYDVPRPVMEGLDGIPDVTYEEIYSQLAFKTDVTKSPIDFFGWSADDMLTLVMAGQAGDYNAVSGKFMAIIILIAKGGGPDGWWDDLRTALGEALDKTKPFKPRPKPGEPPKVRPLGKMPTFLSVINAVYLRRGDAGLFEVMASKYQLSATEKSGTEIMALAVQASLQLFETPCVLVHDAKNAYNMVSLDRYGRWCQVQKCKGVNYMQGSMQGRGVLCLDQGKRHLTI